MNRRLEIISSLYNLLIAFYGLLRTYNPILKKSINDISQLYHIFSNMYIPQIQTTKCSKCFPIITYKSILHQKLLVKT